MSALILQLSPPWWVQTEKGDGWALLVTDIGADHNKVFTVHIHETGEFLDFNIKQIRGCENATYGIPRPFPPNVLEKTYVGISSSSWLTRGEKYRLIWCYRKNGTEGPILPEDLVHVKCDDGAVRSFKYENFT